MRRTLIVTASMIGVAGAVAVGSAAASPSHATATRTAGVAYHVRFWATETDNFLGLGGVDPKGTFTNEFGGVITLTKARSGAYTGTAPGSYRTACGSTTEPCQQNGNSGQTINTETSGNATTVSASLVTRPHGAALVSIWFGGRPSENYSADNQCAGITLPYPNLLWWSAFEAAYGGPRTVQTPSGPRTTLPLKGVRGGYSYSAYQVNVPAATKDNLAVDNITQINVTRTSAPTASSGATRAVPSVVGDLIGTAEAAIRADGLTVGKVTTRTVPLSRIGRVVAMSPSPRTKVKRGTKINLTVGI